MAVLALGGIVHGTYLVAKAPLPFAVDPQATRFYGPHEISTHLSLIKPFFDARGQTLAHLAMTAATTLLVVLGAVFGPFRAAARLGYGTGMALTVAGFLAPFYSPGPKVRFFLFALPVAPLLVLAGRRQPRSWKNAVLGASTLLALVLATLPGLLPPSDFSRYSWYEMTYSQSHWSIVVAPGDLLAQGRRLLVDVRPEYGVVLPVLWGAAERAFGAFSLGDSVHLLIGLQALYLALSAWLLGRAARGRWLFAAVALAAIVPWYHFAHRSLLFPNQSAWRTIGMPLALVALFATPGMRPRPVAYWLGGVAGATLLFNPESGIAVTAGLGTFLCFRHGAFRNSRGFLLLAADFLVGLLIAAGAFVILCRLLLADFIPLARLPQLFLGKAAFLSGAGFSGFRWTPDPWPVFMLGHAVFVLLQSAFAARAAAGFRPSLRAAAAATLVVWFAYYANRPDPWNLSSYYLLYGILLVDLLRYLALGVARRRASPRLLAAAAFLVTLVLPNVLAMAIKGADQVRSALGPTLRREVPSGAALMSGVFVAGGPAHEVTRRAEYIRSRSAEPPVYLTADSYLIPKVAGVSSAMPAVDFCWEALTREVYDRTLRAIARSPSGRVYFDAPGTEAFHTICGAFYREVRRDLENTFERSGVEQGWEVWTRKR